MRSANAYFFSVLLHALAIGLIFILGYVLSETEPAAPKVFELVAGMGDNYGATEAPALGSPTGLKSALAAAAAPAEPAPPAEIVPPAAMTPVPVPLPTPEEAAPAEPVPVSTPAPSKAAAKPPKPVNLTKSLKRTISRTTTRLVNKIKKAEAAEKRRELSYEEYQQEHGAAKSAAARGRQIDAEGIREGVVGGSASNKTGGAGGRALTREQESEMDAYFSLLEDRIHANYVPPSDVSDKLMAGVEFYLAADGSISRVRIVQSSGNSAFDEAALEAFKQTRSIGPRPDGHGETVRLKFRLRDEE